MAGFDRRNEAVSGWPKEWSKKKFLLNDSYITTLIDYRLVNGLEK